MSNSYQKSNDHDEKTTTSTTTLRTTTKTATTLSSSNHQTSTTARTSQNGPNGQQNQQQHKSLVPLLRYFLDMEFIIELKTGKMYRGILQSMDHNDMNITLENAIQVVETTTTLFQQQPFQQQQQQQFQPVVARNNHNHLHNNNNNNDMDDDTTSLSSSTTTTPNMMPIQLLSLMQIRGSTIRYIHFTDPILVTKDVSVIIKQGMDRERSAQQKYKRGIRK